MSARRLAGCAGLTLVNQDNNMATDFLASEYEPAPPDAAAFYVIPCPWERSVSYGHGAAQGPAAILEASQELEALEYGMAPGEGGIYTAPPIDCNGEPEQVLGRIEHSVAAALRRHAIPVLLGGEHTCTLGALRAFGHWPPVLPLGIVQFDAHADLRAEYGGDRYSHASVMRRVAEELGLPLVQIAGRDLSREELEFRDRSGVIHYDAHFLARVGLPEKPLPEDFPKHIYISFDVDALDSSLMPATGTPSPGGLNWREAHFILEACARGRTIVGLDVMELAPIEGLTHASFTAAKLTHLLMGLAWQSQHGGTGAE